MTQTNTHNPAAPNWCPGCGDYGIWSAFKMAATKSGWDNSNSVIVAGIGCHGHIVNFVNMTSFEGLHGRPLPVAAGIKMVNPRLNVIVFTGDGDCLGEGGNHLLHSARRNHDLTVILHDNAVYGLTTGQTSPASPKGYVSRSTPEGNPDEPLHPLAIAIAAGATFVARAYSGNIPELSELMARAVNHKGFAIIDILQPCVTFNHLYTHAFFQKNIYKLGDDYDKTNKAGAFAKSLEWASLAAGQEEDKKIPVGILYEVDAPTCEEQLPIYHQNKAPVIERGLGKRDVSDILNRYV